MITPDNRRLMIMLGILSLITFGGPIPIWLILAGGDSPDWPPDRPVEWVVVIGLAVIAFGMMLAIVVMGLSNWKKNLPKSDRSLHSTEHHES